MSTRESSSVPSHLYETPGAFPEQLEDGEGVKVASDLNSLSRAVHARRAEYIRQKQVRIRIGSWNIAALTGPEQDLGKWFATSAEGEGKDLETAERQVHRKALSEHDAETEEAADSIQEGDAGKTKPTHSTTSTLREYPDIFVLGLQEIVDVTSPTETLKPYVDPTPSNRWKDGIQRTLPPGYKLVSSQQLTGMLLLIYASQSIFPSISSVSSTSVGTGLMGYMGNKGAVATRIILGGKTRIVFINCHLAAGADKASLERRNWDTSQIVARMRFDSIEQEDDIDPSPSQTLGDEEFAFWFGDLNYRLDGIPGEDVRRLLHLHTENNFALSGKTDVHHRRSLSQESSHTTTDESTELEPQGKTFSMLDNDVEPLQDPASLETTLVSLLPHDQLRAQQKKRKAFHEGWKEGNITFLPTYKYDIGRIGKFDSGEKQRSPSWCDRILYRTKQDYLEYLRRTKEAEDSRKRDDEMKSLGLDQESEDASVLFDYDPENDGADYDENDDVDTDSDTDIHQATGSEDLLSLVRYTSHQNVVSSDHKPLHADFILTYDAVVEDLKAKVHQEVARELDKAENEARPELTLVVDQPAEKLVDKKAVVNDVAEKDTVSFGHVRYDVPVSRSLTLANTGSVPATFSFQYRPIASGNDQRVCPPWLHLRVDWPADGDAPVSNLLNEYTLPPGESVHVQLILCIFDIAFVRELNTGKDKIEDVLVLRIANGRDHFISVRGEWLPSCFGFSLEELTCIPEGGIRKVDVSTFWTQSSESDLSENARTSAPRELFRLTEAVAELTERSIAEWGMIGDGTDNEDNARPWLSDRAGWPFDPETWTLSESRQRYKYLGLIREGLDTGYSFFAHFSPEIPSRHRAELLAETLLSFLRSLKHGLITSTLWNELEKQFFLVGEKMKPTPLPAEQAQSRILEALSGSPTHSVSFTFLTFMLNRIANEIAPLTPLPMSMPISPTTPTTPSVSPVTYDSSNNSQVPTSSVKATPLSSPVRSTISFPFRFKTRSRTLSSSDGNDTPNSYPDPQDTKSGTKPFKHTSARRQLVNKAFSHIFADVIFSRDIASPEKDKGKRALDERKRSVIQSFLRSDIED